VAGIEGGRVREGKGGSASARAHRAEGAVADASLQGGCYGGREEGGA
jgi:hypothetical protein